MGSSSSRTKFDHTIESLQFDLGTIRNATNNFSAAIKLGEGRLGAVYKGVLPDGREIAVKRVPRTTCSRHEIKNEVELLLKIQHRNHVRLLGFCLEEEKGNQAIIFIYEYLPNGSLDKYIFDNTKKSYLDWNKRYKIIVGIARGLLYAHEDSRIHGDLKATNILLDAEMNPKVADFGMSRFFHIYQTQGNSTRIGTIGYMAPEYLLEGFVSEKADVYSFGVLLLEIMSGKRITSHLPTPPHNLLGYAWNQWSEGTAIELIDPSLTGWLSRDEPLRSIHIGLLCVQNKVEDRPTMREVVRMLNNYSNLARSPFPSKPEFYRETELDQCNTSSDVYVYDIRANESLQFDLDSIRNATDNFSASNKIGEGGFSNVYKNKIGEGGFSNVYKGVLSGQEIAVKRVSSLEDFKNEVMLMHRLKLQHRNVVRVLGFYMEGKEKILIHEYVPNGSLDSYLFDNIKGSYLDWGRRYKIIGDIARGLLYLHEGSRFKIIHRDLKSQNILLDGAMNAKIADFSLAKLFVHHQTQGRTSRITGTLGYMAPEYIRDGLISVKSDVFSFGVLLLEIVSGRRANGFHYVDPEYTHVWGHWMNGSALDRLVDPSLPDNFGKDEVMRCIHIGLLCVQQNVEDRPTMSSVVGMLNDHSLTLEAPLQPAFCAEISSNIATRETELDQCNTSSDGYDIRADESLRYDLATIRIATSNFSDSYKISEDERGIVYKGVLWAQEIAVTRASSNSTLGFKNFKNELKLMHKLRLQHPNLVRVLGFCQDGEEKLLIHEYVPNSSLDSYLFDDIKRSYLDWGKRYKIIGDIARGLLYLHEGSRFKIIHRDLKSQNILLDGAMNAKIANFGLAKLFEHHQTEGEHCTIVGTIGYIAPEYALHGLFSVKSDVFSFGILLLEIVGGQRTNSYHYLEYSHLSYHWMNGSALDRLVDPSLHDNFGKDEVMRCIHIGLLCVQENVEDRPTMSSVVGMLNDHSFTLEAPSQLAFCAENSSNIATRETELEDSGAESCNSSPFNPR